MKETSHFLAGWYWARCHAPDANRYWSPAARARTGLALSWFVDGIDAFRRRQLVYDRRLYAPLLKRPRR